MGQSFLTRRATDTGSTKLDTSGSANTEIFVKLGTDNALPTTTVLTLDGQGTGTGSGRYCELNLNGHDQRLAGLTSVTRSLRTQRVVNIQRRSGHLDREQQQRLYLSGSARRERAVLGILRGITLA